MSFIDINHYYESATASSGGWMEKTIPTLVGVLIGFGLNKAHDYYKNKKDVTIAGEDFVNELNLLSEPLENQLSSLDKAIAQMESKDLVTPNVTINIAFVSQRFESIDRLKVSKYFKQTKKEQGRKIVNHLTALVKRVEIDAERIEKYFNEYMAESQKQFDVFHQAANRMLREFSEEVAKVEKEGKTFDSDPLIKDALPFLSRFSRNENLNLVQLTEHVCYPILEVTGKHRTHERSKVLSRQNAFCFDAYKATLEAKSIFAERLKQIKTSIKEIQTQLQSNLDACPK